MRSNANIYLTSHSKCLYIRSVVWSWNGDFFPKGHNYSVNNKLLLQIKCATYFKLLALSTAH